MKIKKLGSCKFPVAQIEEIFYKRFVRGKILALNRAKSKSAGVRFGAKDRVQFS
jgi:hypothetical protein